MFWLFVLSAEENGGKKKKKEEIKTSLLLKPTFKSPGENGYYGSGKHNEAGLEILTLGMKNNKRKLF